MPVRRVLTVGEFTSLTLRMHPCRVSDGRVSEIADFVHRHKFLRGEIVLATDRALGSSPRPRPHSPPRRLDHPFQRTFGSRDSYIVIDGVHRAEAIRGLAASGLLTEADGPIVGTCTFGPDEYEPDELMRMFHAPVDSQPPSPSRHPNIPIALRALEDELASIYAPFVSRAQSPRRPNFNPVHVVDAIAEQWRGAQLCSSSPRSVTEWVNFIVWRNDEVLALNPCIARELAIALAAKSSSRPGKARRGLCFALSIIDPTHVSWIQDPAAWARWRSSPAPVRNGGCARLEKSRGTTSRSQSSRSQSSRPIPRALRQAVWNQYAGGPSAGTAMCSCCRITPITQQDFECGHVVSVAMGGPTSLNNMRPICRSCNRSMGRTDMRVFQATYFDDPMEVEVPPPQELS